MLTTNNILAQLPSFIAEDPYVREILLAKEGEFNTLDEVQADILAQFKVDTATWGLTWWERSLGLSTPTNPLGYYDLEQDDPIIKYHGDWTTVDLRKEDSNFEANRGDSDGLIKRCSAKDTNWLEFSFYGTGFKLFRSAAQREYSSFYIIVDGDEEWHKLGNNSNTNPVYNWCFYEKQNMRLGIHTIRLYADTPDASNNTNKQFVLDKIQINNSVDINYDLRRKRIKAKLVPIINVTNDAIRELARSYGFEITIDESVPYVYSIDFDQNSNVDPGLRRQLLLDLENIIPSHIELDSKFFISTFYDIDQHNLTWDEAKQLYTFYDFLTNSKPDVFGKYSNLYKYSLQSKFNYEHFNDDLMATDTIYQQHIIDKEHDTTSTNIKNQNISYDFMTVDNIHNKFSNVNRMLLTDQKRNQITRLTNGKGYNGETVTEIINNYVAAKKKIESAVENHPYLQQRPGNVNKANYTALLDKTKEFAITSSQYTVGKTSVTPEQVRRGKIVYNQPNSSGAANTLVKVTGIIDDYDVAQYYAEIGLKPTEPGGGSNLMVTETYTIPRQYDLKAENIKKGTVMWDVVGTMETTPNDYNVGDIFFDWQLEDNGDSFNILS